MRDTPTVRGSSDSTSTGSRRARPLTSIAGGAELPQLPLRRCGVPRSVPRGGSSHAFHSRSHRCRTVRRRPRPVHLCRLRGHRQHRGDTQPGQGRQLGQPQQQRLRQGRLGHRRRQHPGRRPGHAVVEGPDAHRKRAGLRAGAGQHQAGQLRHRRQVRQRDGDLRHRTGHLREHPARPDQDRRRYHQ